METCNSLRSLTMIRVGYQIMILGLLVSEEGLEGG